MRLAKWPVIKSLSHRCLITVHCRLELPSRKPLNAHKRTILALSITPRLCFLEGFHDPCSQAASPLRLAKSPLSSAPGKPECNPTRLIQNLRNALAWVSFRFFRVKDGFFREARDQVPLPSALSSLTMKRGNSDVKYGRFTASRLPLLKANDASGWEDRAVFKKLQNGLSIFDDKCQGNGLADKE